MGIATYPQTSSPIKSIQRGTATVAGTITITSVDTTKTFVRSFSNGSAGTVAINSTTPSSTVSGSISGTLSPSAITFPPFGMSGSNAATSGTLVFPTFSTARSISGSATVGAMTGGSTNLVAITYGVSLTNSTTLTATGACNWEVVEYN